MVLAEDHILLRPVLRLQGANAAFQSAPDACRQCGMAAEHLVEQGDRPQPWRRREHRHDLGFPDHGQ